MDAEWGVAMRLDSVRPFPWPMTLGAIKDSTLIRKIGKRMGEQEKRLGIVKLMKAIKKNMLEMFLHQYRVIMI